MRTHVLRIFGVFVAALAVSLPAKGANLSAIRVEASGEGGSAAQEARQRVQRLRDLLGTQSVVFPALSEQGSVFTQRAEYQRSHELKTAEYFKRKLLVAANQLQTEEQYGAPAVFDPSLFAHEQDERTQERRRAFFERVLGNDFEALYQELEAQVSVAKKTSDATPLPANAGPTVVSLTQLIAWFLEHRQPEVFVTAPVPEGQESAEPQQQRQTIESVLGKLYRVDVFDDVVTKLRFSKLDLPLGSLQTVPDADEVALSLSMLIAVRTELDNYLVFVLGYIGEKLDARKAALTERQTELEKHGLWFGENEEHAANAEKLRKLELVLTHMREQYSGAVAANQLLGQLTEAQLDFLIDLMLQLRGDDVPVDRDIQKLTELAQAEPDRVLNTYQFYNQMDDELYRLETYVEAENRMAAQVQKIIEGMKK